jgi:RimJ/RimL family protein N-acetyltransferase
LGWDEVMIFETERLMIRAAGPEDVELFHQLWTDPRVMTNVGFPQGLPITHQEIREKLLAQAGQVYDSRLVVTLKHGGAAIGECKLGRPNDSGVSETDIKLLPAYWGHKYGVEVKRGLVNYLFRHTECQVVQATPNVKNVASIKMQEAVGGVRVGEAVDEFPASMADYTTPVHHYIYHVRRGDWEKGAWR